MINVAVVGSAYGVHRARRSSHTKDETSIRPSFLGAILLAVANPKAWVAIAAVFASARLADTAETGHLVAMLADERATVDDVHPLLQPMCHEIVVCARLIAEAARKSDLASALLDVCHAQYVDTVALGHGHSDMVAVIRAIGARTESTGRRPC